ncbi:hypothetical protein VPHD51_0089 [Vibrio phage D51]
MDLTQTQRNIFASCILSGHRKRSEAEKKKIVAAAKRLQGII